jgi:hypothetical protein
LKAIGAAPRATNKIERHRQLPTDNPSGAPIILAERPR